MKFKTYIGIGILSILLILIIITLFRVPSNNKNDIEKESDNEVQYTKKQYKQAEKRKDYENKIDEKVREYITKTNAPKNQSEYDEAIKMRSNEEQNRLKRNVSDLVKDKERSIEDLYTTVNFDNKSELSGEYEYTLNYKKGENIMSETKQGEFTIKTNDEGYFYIAQFN